MDNMIVVMLAGLLTIGVILLLIIGFGKKGRSRLDKTVYQQDWLAIESSLGSDPSSQQFAVMQADKLLDRALRESGYRGQTMGERMVSAARVFSQRNAIWAAHKLRNRIAHEDNVHITPKLTRQALASFKRGLKDLGAL
ncbi:MAG: hypothetical protein WAW60_00500 [Candidatus Saccharimonadales bacterium]